jgi:hypothetical protein
MNRLRVTFEVTDYSSCARRNGPRRPRPHHDTGCHSYRDGNADMTTVRTMEKVSIPPPPPTGRWLDLIHRMGAAVLGVGLCVFGVLGVANRLEFLALRGKVLLGLGSNGLLATISLIVGGVLIGAALRGGRVGPRGTPSQTRRSINNRANPGTATGSLPKSE